MGKATQKTTQTKQAESLPIQTITGTVTKRIFYNADNGYCVLSVQLKDSVVKDDEIKATGNMPSVREGDEYEFIGEYIEHPKFGRQFKFTESKLHLPNDAAGLVRYLSETTNGVGIKKATKIMDHLGENALQKIADNPEILDTLTFLTAEQRRDIVTDLSANNVQAELAGIVCKQGNGLGMGLVAKIMMKYGQDAVRTIKENPYILADELWGVGFIKADLVAQATGVALNSPYRIEAAVDYAVRKSGNDGHVYLRPRDIINRTIGRQGLVEASGIEVADIAQANQKLIDSGKCVRDGDCIYAKPLYEAEIEVAKAVRRLNNIKVSSPNRVILDVGLDMVCFDGAALDTMIDDVQASLALTASFSPNQRHAIRIALTSGLSVITGPPGSGKSFTLKGITEIYTKLYPFNEIYLCAPTGRAAKRMNEATRINAMTIHRLLAYSPMDGFRFNAKKPLPGPGLLIMDESSMADVTLAAALLSALDTNIQVVLVGDIDQLPSVGAGSVLRDIIASGAVPTTRLDYNYRQAGGSKIAEYASMVCRGIVPPLCNAGDFEFVPIEVALEAQAVVLNLVKDIVNAGYKPLDWTVLAPMRNGHCGVIKLNEMIREIVNPSMVGAALGIYRPGDKVMIIKNDYYLNVFNGDVGIVTHIEGGKMMINFGGESHSDIKEFTGENLEILTLAYASTIHKFQGSEVPIVIMPLTKQHYMLLQRNLLYTGITRAKHRLILVADEWSVKKAVENNVIEERFSKLKDRICAAGEGGLL